MAATVLPAMLVTAMNSAARAARNQTTRWWKWNGPATDSRCMGVSWKGRDGGI